MGQARPTKNVETDIVGDKIGRVHLGRQDLSELQIRKMKGLKRTRGVEGAEVNGEEASDEISEQEEVEAKKPKLQ